MIRAKLVETDIKLHELLPATLSGLRGDGVALFEERLRELSGLSGAVVFGSASAALVAALKVLKETSPGKDEVIIPAYTPDRLYIAAKQAGLKPVLSDIELSDFGFSQESFAERVNGKTLAAITVRLFGLENSFSASACGVSVIEDNAQGFISPLKGAIEVISFNRGKNFPLMGGGALLTNDAGIASRLNGARKKLPKTGIKQNILTGSKLKALALAKYDILYNLLLPLISAVRENSAPVSIEEFRLSSWQAMLGANRLAGAEDNSKRRFVTAQKYKNALGSIRGITLPEIKAGSVPNRFPILVKDSSQIEKLCARLLKRGIESSLRFYKTIHREFPAEKFHGSFKNAEYIAEHLVALPCHPFLRDKDIYAAAEEARKCCL